MTGAPCAPVIVTATPIKDWSCDSVSGAAGGVAALSPGRITNPCLDPRVEYHNSRSTASIDSLVPANYSS